MKIITRQKRANETAKNWARQYQGGFYGGDKMTILARLESLGDTPSPDEVDRVIGNGSWTRTKCDECGAENVDVVEMGEEPDYESRTVEVCKDCLSKALAL